MYPKVYYFLKPYFLVNKFSNEEANISFNDKLNFLNLHYSFNNTIILVMDDEHLFFDVVKNVNVKRFHHIFQVINIL